MIKSLINFSLLFFSITFLPISAKNIDNNENQFLLTYVEPTGKYVILDDGTLYEINRSERQIVKNWSYTEGRADKVVVINTKNINFEYPFIIKNLYTSKSVSARLPKYIEEPPQEEAPSEEDGEEY
jgi:hypothetical protein